MRQLTDVHGLVIAGDFQTYCEAFADALDAVVCAYAAAAVARNRLGTAPSEIAAVEGWIAVHE